MLRGVGDGADAGTVAGEDGLSACREIDSVRDGLVFSRCPVVVHFRRKSDSKNGGLK